MANYRAAINLPGAAQPFLLMRHRALKQGEAMNYYATMEHLRAGEAVVTLTDEGGQWAGSGLVQCRSGHRDALCEVGYNVASQSAAAKGGRLVRFSEI